MAALEGLSGFQALQGGSASLGKVLPKPKTDHPYVLGLIFTGIGLFVLVGSITGTLPSMLAALFVPHALEDANQKEVTSPLSLTPTKIVKFLGTGVI